MTLANRITLIRAFLAVIVLICILNGAFAAKVAALVIFIVAAASDWIDGTIARKTKTTTIFGAIADPFVDKILVVACFIAFAGVKSLSVPLWAVFLILARELTVSTLRVLAGIKGKVLSAERSGKFKTAIQFISVSVILVILNLQTFTATYEGYVNPTFLAVIKSCAKIPYALTVITAVVTWMSGISYIKNHWKLLSSTWSVPKK